VSCSVLFVGFGPGEIPSIPANMILVKCISVVGVASGASLMKFPHLGRLSICFRFFFLFIIIVCVSCSSFADLPSFSHSVPFLFFLYLPFAAKEAFTQMIKLASKGLVTPFIGASYSAENYKSAMKQLIDRDAKGKICIVWNPSMETQKSQSPLNNSSSSNNSNTSFSSSLPTSNTMASQNLSLRAKL
jgi:hypothetical protein